MNRLGNQSEQLLKRLDRMAGEMDGAPVPRTEIEKVAKTLGPIGLGMSRLQLYGSLASLEMHDMIDRVAGPEGGYSVEQPGVDYLGEVSTHQAV